MLVLLAQLTMSARAFPITLCPSSVRLSVRLSVCLSVRLSVCLLDYFSKPISSHSFRQIAFKFLTGIKYDVAHPACAFLDDRTISGFLANFWNFWNNGMIYSNCKMHLLLQLSFDRFEIMQVSSLGYKHYGLCFFWQWNIFSIFGEFLKFGD